VVTGIVAFSLFIGGLAQWQNSGTGEGWRFAGYLQRWGLCVLACYIVVAVGVILLGWHWFTLAGKITSIANHIGKKILDSTTWTAGKSRFQISDLRKIDNINGLEEVLTQWLNDCSGYLSELENQIKDLQIQIQLSQRREKNTEAIIYSIRDAVIVIDEFDKLLMANEAAGKLFGFDFKTSQHKPISELIGADHREFVDLLSHSRQTGGRAMRQEVEFSQEGGPKTFDCIISRVYDRAERICGVVAVLHDITREKEISQMKNDFVSHVSHELKTPLASIMAYSEMLSDGEANDEQTRKEFYSVIQNQAKRLNRLIEDILNISRIESGLIKVNKEPVSLTILIEEQLQMIKSYAEEKNIEVISPKPIVFDQVNADKDMISQVIVNLLSNAVKYTRPGGEVRINAEVDEIEGLARVSITDTGVGIPENELGHLFEKFYRVEANKNVAKGTGLGLNLVKQIIEKVHNGRVFVESKVGEGSTFGFELPLANREAVETVQK
jgi:two-component system, OmpR family, phosphate regulon sensor histidine kinase PhoR